MPGNAGNESNAISGLTDTARIFPNGAFDISAAGHVREFVKGHSDTDQQAHDRPQHAPYGVKKLLAGVAG
jgi:hypothetical protein